MEEHCSYLPLETVAFTRQIRDRLCEPEILITEINDSENEDLDVPLTQFDFNVDSAEEISLSSDSNEGENSLSLDLKFGF